MAVETPLVREGSTLCVCFAMLIIASSIESRVDTVNRSTSAGVRFLVSIGGRTIGFQSVSFVIPRENSMKWDSPLILIEPALNRKLRGDRTWE